MRLASVSGDVSGEADIAVATEVAVRGCPTSPGAALRQTRMTGIVAAQW